MNCRLVDIISGVIPTYLRPSFGIGVVEGLYWISDSISYVANRTFKVSEISGLVSSSTLVSHIAQG